MKVLSRKKITVSNNYGGSILCVIVSKWIAQDYGALNKDQISERRTGDVYCKRTFIEYAAWGCAFSDAGNQLRAV